MVKKVKILGFVGSLRKGSYSKTLMRTAAELVPENIELEVFDIEGIPPVQPGLGTAANASGESANS